MTAACGGCLAELALGGEEIRTLDQIADELDDGPPEADEPGSQASDDE